MYILKVSGKNSGERLDLLISQDMSGFVLPFSSEELFKHYSFNYH